MTTAQDQTRVVPLVAPLPEAPEPAPVASKNRRDYRVLEELDGDSFRRVGVYSVGDGKAAIRAAAKEHGTGIYIAVAASAWTRHPVTSRTRESLVLG